MINIKINDIVLFTNDLFWTRRVGQIKAVYLKGTIGENYKIESEGKVYDGIGVDFIIAKL